MSKAPKGWATGRVEDFFTLQRGFDITGSEAIQGNIPVISSSGFSYYHNEAKVQPPGVITGRKGKLGDVYYVDVPFWPHDTTLWVKDFKGNYPLYVAIFLEYLKLDRFDAATSVPTLNRNNVHSLKVSFPPLEEQRKIAAILGTWDAVIAVVEQLIAALQRRKQGLMQRLLTGEVRFPGFDGEWEEVRLGAVVDSFSGGTPSRTNPEYYEGNIPWIKSGEINQVHIVETEETITQLGLENSSAKIVDAGTLLLALYGATAGKLGISHISAAINQALLAIVPHEELNKDFAFYELEHRMPQMLRKLQGGQPNLSAALVKSSYISLPPFEEQQVIAEVLSEADRQIYEFHDLRTHLQQQKKGLMQRLLTGAVRV